MRKLVGIAACLLAAACATVPSSPGYVICDEPGCGDNIAVVIQE